MKHENQREQFPGLSTYLQTAREEERRSIAREIHDELGQALTTIKLELSLLHEEVLQDATAATKRLQSLQQQIDDTIHSVKHIITKLRPGLLDDLGLVAAIEWQASDIQQRSGIVCEVKTPPKEFLLPPEMATSVFRIFQETMTNIVRHSGSTHVQVELTHDHQQIQLRVQDNGRGITREELFHPKSFGILGMQERAHAWHGSIKIHGDAGTGTVMTLIIPIDQQAHA